MTPTEQTLLTLLCMLFAFWWGWREGNMRGVTNTVNFFHDNGMLKDEYVIDLREEDEEDE